MDVRGPTNQNGPRNQISPAKRGAVRVEGAEQSVPAPPSSPPLRATESETTRLIRELQQLPEIREEMVEISISKLRSGELLERDSAERTAEAILRAYDKE